MRISSAATIFAAFATLFLGSAVNAASQAATASHQAEPAITATATPAPCAPAPVADPFKLTFDETVQVVNFDKGNTLVGFNQTLLFDLKGDLDFTINVPVYTLDGSTSVGDLDIGGSWLALKGNNKYLHDWTLTVNGGMFLPVGTEEFRSENVVPYIGTELSCKLWDFDFKQSVEYTFVGNGYFMPLIAEKTTSDILAFGSDLTVYKQHDFTIGVDLDQYYYVETGNAQVFLGPVATWKFGSLDLNASVQLPIYQDSPKYDADVVCSVGFGFQF